MANNEIDNNVGRIIREKRTIRGLTQRDIGDVLGVTFQQIQKIETGQNRISAGNLKLVADFMKVSILDFYGEPEIESEADRHEVMRIKRFRALNEKAQKSLLKTYEDIAGD